MRRLVVLWLLLPAVALAQPERDLERAKASFKAGATAYAAGEYLAAIQALDAAYALTPLPPIAFSLAQAERRQYFVDRDRKHLDRAITLYRQYLGQVSSGGRRADALDALAQLEPLALAKGEGGVAPAEERATRLMIICEAPGAAITLDDGPPAPSPLIREVAPGPHRVVARGPGFFEAERELTAVSGELVPVELVLRERPSLLSVSVPPDAQLFIDGAFAGRGQQQLTLQLPGGVHRLVVARKGHHVSSRALTLARGETHSLHVALEPTGQRRLSKWMFLASGVAVGAAATFGTLALHFEGEAHDFLTRRERGNVTPGELHEYNSDVTSRARTRTGAAIALGSAVGLFVTGLLLYQLDDPQPQDLYRPVDPGPAASLRFTPVLTAATAGAQLEGRF